MGTAATTPQVYNSYSVCKTTIWNYHIRCSDDNGNERQWRVYCKQRERRHCRMLVIERFSNDCRKNQNQSNYSEQSQQEQTAPWTNYNCRQSPVTRSKRGKNHAYMVRLVFLLIGWKTGATLLNQSLSVAIVITQLLSTVIWKLLCLKIVVVLSSLLFSTVTLSFCGHDFPKIMRRPVRTTQAFEAEHKCSSNLEDYMSVWSGRSKCFFFFFFFKEGKSENKVIELSYSENQTQDTFVSC